MKWLRNKLRKWLGIEENCRLIQENSETIKNLVSIGVDVHFKEPHMILIYSKLRGGQIRHIPVRLDNIRDLQNLVQELKNRYKTNVETWDNIQYPGGRHWL